MLYAKLKKQTTKRILGFIQYLGYVEIRDFIYLHYLKKEYNLDRAWYVRTDCGYRLVFMRKADSIQHYDDFFVLDSNVKKPNDIVLHQDSRITTYYYMNIPKQVLDYRKEHHYKVVVKKNISKEFTLRWYVSRLFKFKYSDI